MTGINEVAKEIHENARAHGWWDEERGFPEVLALIHKYVYSYGTSAFFAERYKACAVEISSLGGDGGGNLTMPINVTYGGERTVGSVTVAEGKFTFTAGAGA